MSDDSSNLVDIVCFLSADGAAAASVGPELQRSDGNEVGVVRARAVSLLHVVDDKRPLSSNVETSLDRDLSVCISLSCASGLGW